MKKTFVSLLLLLFSISLISQTKWYNPIDAEYPVVQNRGWENEISNSYQRLPDRAKDVVRRSVWDLSQNSAGVAIHFKTNAEKIQIRYGVTGDFAMPHMPATGKSGVDLYAIDSDGNWRYLSDSYHFSDTITYTYNNIIPNTYHKNGFEYRLFLPLYNSVTWMEIGVPESSEFSFMPLLKEKPIFDST